MNADNFIQVLKQPEQLAQLSYAELDQLVTAYPFCQNLRLLVLQKSQQEQNQHLAANIRLAATYSNDRSHFYQYFRSSTDLNTTINPYQMAEDFLEQHQDQNMPSPTEEAMPKAAGQGREEEVLQFNLSDPNQEDITHEVNFSKSYRMEDDDSMEFNLDEHLKKFQEENAEPDHSPEETPFTDQGDHVFFLEDLIAENEMPPIEEAIVEEAEEAEAAAIAESELPAEEVELAPEVEPEIPAVPLESVEEAPPLVLNAAAEKAVKENTIKEEAEQVESPIDATENMETVEMAQEVEAASTANIEESPEEKTPLPELVISLEKEDAPVSEESNVSSTEETNDIPLEITNIPVEEQPPPLPTPVPKTSFSSWLQQFKSPKPMVSPKQMEAKPAKKVEAKPDLTPPLEAPTEVEQKTVKQKSKKSSKKRKQKKVRDLDQLKGLPKDKEKASAGKKGKKSKKKEKIQQFAAQSLNDDEEIASETLAIILAKQGAYHKAMRIYERLKLIYPEKSSFFASKIEELNKLI